MGSSAGFLIFLAFIHLLIMPLFFLIGGASMRYAIEVKNNHEFLRERFIRLMIPFMTGALAIVPLHYFLLDLLNSQTALSFGDYYLLHFKKLSYTFDPAVFGVIGQQLWFLSFLFIYSLITLRFVRYLENDQGKTSVSMLATLCEKKGAILLFVVPITLVQAALRVKFPAYRDWADFFYWFIFFLYGYILMSDKRFMQAVAKHGLLALFIGCSSFAGIVIYSLNGNLVVWFFQPKYSTSYLLFLVLSVLNTWCWTVFFLSVGLRFLNFTNTFLRYSNELLLPFYILHLTIISLIGSLIINWNATKINKFIFVSTTAFTATALITIFVVSRNNVLRFLLGMKLKK